MKIGRVEGEEIGMVRQGKGPLFGMSGFVEGRNILV